MHCQCYFAKVKFVFNCRKRSCGHVTIYVQFHAQVWHPFSRDLTVYLHTRVLPLTEWTIPALPSQPKLVLTYRPRRDGRLSWTWVVGWLHTETRNTFCGTWYLPHSHVHNERTVPIIMTGCMAHEREGYISTSGPKSDVTVVFHDPDVLYDAGISAIRP